MAGAGQAGPKGRLEARRLARKTSLVDGNIPNGHAEGGAGWPAGWPAPKRTAATRWPRRAASPSSPAAPARTATATPWPASTTPPRARPASAKTGRASTTRAAIPRRRAYFRRPHTSPGRTFATGRTTGPGRLKAPVKLPAPLRASRFAIFRRRRHHQGATPLQDSCPVRTPRPCRRPQARTGPDLALVWP